MKEISTITKVDYCAGGESYVTPGGTTVRLHPVEVEDKFATDPIEADRITRAVEELSEQGFFGDPRIDLERKRTRRDIRLDNPSTRSMMEIIEGFASWHREIPEAKALEHIYHPDEGHLPDGTRLGEEAEATNWLTYISDALGIRSRASVVQDIISKEIEASESPLKVASLACGLATPMLELCSYVKNREGLVVPEFKLADYDKSALNVARDRAKEMGVIEHFEFQRTNILRPEGIAIDGLKGVLAERLFNKPKRQFDVVELVGILEYLDSSDWVRHFEYGEVIKVNKLIAGATNLIKNSFDLVEPGGRIIFGNMLNPRPQLGLTINVVQWPHIKPRSIKEVLQLLEASKIDLSEGVDVHLPDDGVYAIYSVRKPEAYTQWVA